MSETEEGHWVIIALRPRPEEAEDVQARTEFFPVSWNSGETPDQAMVRMNETEEVTYLHRHERVELTKMREHYLDKTKFVLYHCVCERIERHNTSEMKGAGNS